jgi:hypothetical protein
MAGASDISNGVLKTEQVPYWMPRMWYDTVMAGSDQGAAPAGDFLHLEELRSVDGHGGDPQWWRERFESFVVADGSHQVTAYRDLHLDSFETKVLLPVDSHGNVMTPEELYLIMQVRNSLPTRKSGTYVLVQLLIF